MVRLFFYLCDYSSSIFQPSCQLLRRLKKPCLSSNFWHLISWSEDAHSMQLLCRGSNATTSTKAMCANSLKWTKSQVNGDLLLDPLILMILHVDMGQGDQELQSRPGLLMSNWESQSMFKPEDMSVRLSSSGAKPDGSDELMKSHRVLSFVCFLCVLCLHPKAFRNSGLRTLRRTPEGTTLQGLWTTSARRTKERSTSAPWADICNVCHICIYFSDSVQYLQPNKVWQVWLGLTPFDYVDLSSISLALKLTLIKIDWNSTDVTCLGAAQSPSYCSQCGDSWLLPSHASRASSFPP